MEIAPSDNGSSFVFHVTTGARDSFQELLQDILEDLVLVDNSQADGTIQAHGLLAMMRIHCSVVDSVVARPLRVFIQQKSQGAADADDDEIGRAHV